MDAPAKSGQTSLAPQYKEMISGYQGALQVVDDVVLKNYISNLSKMEIVPLSKTVMDSNIRDNVLFFFFF